MTKDHRKTVLVVDDDEGIREVVCDILEDAGYTAIGAAHGQEAIVRLATTVPDLILLDLTMPVMDGWAFREWQRTSPAALVPVVVLSAIRDLRGHAAKLGVADFVAKPVQFDRLLEAVAAHV